MSDTANTEQPDMFDGSEKAVTYPVGVPGLAKVLRALATREPTQAELAEIAENPLARGAIEDGMLSPFGQAIKSGAQWMRSQFLDVNEVAGPGLETFDTAYLAVGRAINVLADMAGTVSVVAGVVVAAMELYPYAKGIPDTQVPTLQPDSVWNPEGAPQAPLQLANVPLQVISVATEAQLAAAIATVNASPGNYAIRITSSIVLTANLPAIVQPMGAVQIDGKGNLLYGSNAFRGLVVDGTNVTIHNLMIQAAVANGQGLAGIEGESGNGGGLLAINNAHVALDNVTFADDSAQQGGGAFADPSSSISVKGGGFSDDTATGASGAGSNQGNGSSIFLAGEQVLQVTANPGKTTTVTGGIADQAGQGGIATLVAQGGGTVVLSGAESFSGGLVLTADTTLVLSNLDAAGSGNITFDSQGTGTLQIYPTALDAFRELFPRVSGMTAGDRVDLVGLSRATQLIVEPPVASATTSNGAPVTTVVVSNGTQTESLHFVGLNAGAKFTLASDGQGGTLLTMTRSMPTPSGLSETSAGGVLTFSGEAQAGSTVTLYQIQLGTKTLLQLGTATVGNDGKFSFTPGTQPDAGAGPVTAVATDAYGNASGASDVVSLPAGAGGSSPVVAPGMVAPIPGSIVVRVGTEAQLIAAINEANAGTAQTSLAIQFTNNITLSGMEDLPALQDKAGVQIVGNGYTLQGDGDTRGLVVFGANATIDNLTISDMVAFGGPGGAGAAGGGGGAGLGGGLLVVGDSNVTIDGVNFVDDRAIGGAGGQSAITAGGGYGGGGGLGGAGGSAMPDPDMEISGGGGGVGIQAAGGSGGAAGQTSGGSGIVAGTPSDQSSGAAGGVSGGGGAGGTDTTDELASATDGGGGGIDGLSGSDTSEGGYGSSGGWGGGGGGNYQYGGNGGFGGGGGGSDTQGGYGGFGGGGGGGAPLFSSTGAPGGFGGGAGGPGTNNGTDSGGGGGMGAGGAVFVEAGSSVQVVGSTSSGDSVQGGQGNNGGQDGRAYGSGWFIEGNQSLVLKGQPGQPTVISDVIADETGSHDQSGATGAGSLIIEGKGTVALDASNTYTGGTVITGGTLELGTAGAAGSGNIAFEGRSGTLKIDSAATQDQSFTNVITGFSHGDRIDLAGLAWSAGTSAKVIGTSTTADGTSVTVVGISDPGGQQQLLFQGLPSNAAFVTASDGNGGTKLTLAPSSSVAGASSGAAGHVSNLGSNDARAELSVALERTSPVPGVVPGADSGVGSSAAGRDPTPEAALVALPGTEEHQTIAPAVHDGQGDTSSHHTR